MKSVRLLGFQGYFLNSPVADFTDEEFVGAAAVDLVDHGELLHLFAGFTELAENFAIELQLVDFSVIEIVYAVGV